MTFLATIHTSKHSSTILKHLSEEANKLILKFKAGQFELWCDICFQVRKKQTNKQTNKQTRIMNENKSNKHE